MNQGPALEAAIRLARRDFTLEVELELEPGRSLALVGPSGAGKTSILKTVAGLIKPEWGLIRIAGEKVFESQSRVDVPPEDRRCGYVSQDYSLFPHMDVVSNVGFGIRGVKGAERRSRALELLEQLGIGGLAKARPDSLSGGERQRVALARALATRPALFLLDEPLSALDPETREQALPVLQAAIAEAAVPALIVTHSRHEAETLADASMVLERGRVSKTRSHENAEPGSGSGPRMPRRKVSIHRIIKG